MSHRTYIYDKSIGKMVEKTYQRVLNLSATIIPDINAYRVVGPEYGTVISSRSKHREYLRRNNLIEVGDQKPKWMK